MEFKGTKGKWKIHTKGNLNIISEQNRMVATTGVYQTNIDNGEHVIENEANAKLISYAPEMLEMLKEISEEMKNEGYPEILSKVNNLIKKATEL